MVEDRDENDLADTAERTIAADETERPTDVKGLAAPTVDLRSVRRDSSPFILLAEPKPQAARPAEPENAEEKRPARTSYIPVPREVPVVVRPIQNIGANGPRGAPEAPEAVDDRDIEEIPEPDTVPKPLPDEEPEAIDDQDIEEIPELAAAAHGETDEEPEAIDDADIEELPEAPAEAPGPAAVSTEERPSPDSAQTAPPDAVFLDDRDTAPRTPETGGQKPAPKSPEESVTQTAASETAPDLGTPEMVFDALPAPTAPTAHDEDAEEIDLDGAEELTDQGEQAPDTSESPGTEGQLQSARPPLMRRKRKQKYEWWAEIFDDDYLSLLPPPAARSDRREIDFLEKSLAAPRGSLVLDLACGNGRHAVGMARRGYRVVGVDLSLPMLARAGELAQEHEQKINFIHGDMRELNFDKTFDGVYCIGTSFGYFDDATNYKVIEGVGRALKPGAPFLLEVANRDHVIGKQPNLTWFEGNGSVCMEETSFNFLKSRLSVTRQLIMGSDGRQVKHELSVRLYCLHELGLMLHRAGFVVNQVTGHIAAPGAFFGADSAQIFVLASRPK